MAAWRTSSAAVEARKNFHARDNGIHHSGATCRREDVCDGVHEVLLVTDVSTARDLVMLHTAFPAFPKRWLKCGRPNGLAAISKVPAAGWGQILAYMAFCEVSQDQSPGTPAAAGDFGFKVLTSSDPAEKTKPELANGRLAMMAIIGISSRHQAKDCRCVLHCVAGCHTFERMLTPQMAAWRTEFKRRRQS